jgi:hypothetical protein
LAHDGSELVLRIIPAVQAPILALPLCDRRAGIR